MEPFCKTLAFAGRSACRRPFFRETLGANRALAFGDTGMWRTATGLASFDDGHGHRDLCIVVFNQWGRGKYGAEFEARAMARASAPVTSGA